MLNERTRARTTVEQSIKLVQITVYHEVLAHATVMAAIPGLEHLSQAALAPPRLFISCQRN